MACLLGHSGVVATALLVRVVSGAQRAAYAAAWAELQALVAIEPQVTARHSSVDLLEAALPELDILCRQVVR